MFLLRFNILDYSITGKSCHLPLCTSSIFSLIFPYSSLKAAPVFLLLRRKQNSNAIEISGITVNRIKIP